MSAATASASFSPTGEAGGKAPSLPVDGDGFGGRVDGRL